jgi:hypothetical protein
MGALRAAIVRFIGYDMNVAQSGRCPTRARAHFIPVQCKLVLILSTARKSASEARTSRIVLPVLNFQAYLQENGIERY